jgi:phytoene dehydrogenase-like protein
MPNKTEYDAIVIGSGPNGLSAAIVLQLQGLSVLLIEGRDTIGGGLRTAELTLPGFKHDVCSAIHPMALASPFFESLKLEEHGLQFIHPEFALAHPFADGSAAVLTQSLTTTADLLGEDGKAYASLIKSLVKNWPLLINDMLAPLRFPSHPFHYARFGLKALPSAASTVNKFKTLHARGLWAGIAAHAIQPLTNATTSAIALVLSAAAHVKGWPLPRGGSQSIADALDSVFIHAGGKTQTGWFVKSLSELPSSKAVLFDVTPKQLLAIAGHKFSALYKRQLAAYRYGMGVFKIDWALDAPAPFSAVQCRTAGTVHLGNSYEEIESGEFATSIGRHVRHPFTLFTQPSVFDDTRAPQGKHTAWAYCHVPNGSTRDESTTIERQVERFAPGFRERIIGRHTFNTEQLEAYNPNYIGGDINGGIMDIGQLFTRPALRFSPYKTSAKGLYICSSSTPPGGGVHGMCGVHAAKKALKDIFNIHPETLNKF